MIRNILVGIGSGIISAGVGFLRKENIEPFEGKKFIKTVIIGGIVGGISSATVVIDGQTVQDIVNEFGLMVGITALADRVADLAWNRLKPYLPNFFKV